MSGKGKLGIVYIPVTGMNGYPFIIWAHTKLIERLPERPVLLTVSK
jgi:hypothetical protein